MEYGDVLRRRGAPVQILCNHCSTEQFKSAHKDVEMAWLHQQISCYISLAFLTLLGRFRVGSGVGRISNTIEQG